MLPRTIKVIWELGSDGLSLHLGDFEHKTLLLFPFLLENYLPFMPCVQCKARLSREANFVFYLWRNKSASLPLDGVQKML